MRLMVNTQDLTTQARIRDAAIELIGQVGFQHVTIRQIAQTAGVSAGLVIHHFGSKQGLRQACDAHVQQVLTASIGDLRSYGPSSILSALAHADQLLPVARYGTRTLRDGGPLAQELFDQLVDGTEGWLQQTIDTGEVRAPTDMRAMATLLVCVSLGIHFLERYLVPDLPAEQRAQAMMNSVTTAAVELYTNGLFTTSEYLDAFRHRTNGHPGLASLQHSTSVKDDNP